MNYDQLLVECRSNDGVDELIPKTSVMQSDRVARVRSFDYSEVAYEERLTDAGEPDGFTVPPLPTHGVQPEMARGEGLWWQMCSPFQISKLDSLASSSHRQCIIITIYWVLI